MELKLTSKEKEMLQAVDSAKFGYEVHMSCDPDFRKKLGVLHSLQRKGLLESEWNDAICLNGFVKVFYRKDTE